MKIGSYALVSFLSACLYPTKVTASDGNLFTYDPNSQNGPEYWKDISFDDGTDNQCGGDRNSPIAVESNACETFEDYELTPGTCLVQDFGFVVNNHAEQVNAPTQQVCETNKMKIPGVAGEFEMLQFHIHMNSEHTFDGSHFAAELHVVHSEVGGDRLAVLGMFFVPTALESNALVDDLLRGFDAISDETYTACNMTTLPHWWQDQDQDQDHQAQAADVDQEAVKPRSGSTVTPENPFNVYDLVPKEASMYYYSGGLTTPPCTEIVEWSVVDKPVEITVAQYNDLSSLILNYVDPTTCDFATVADPNSGSTSRPTQPSNGRHVTRICPVGFVEEENVDLDLESASSGRFSVPTWSSFHVLTTMFVGGWVARRF
ncbi:Carbonic anhydrase [Seminavis robusta]|uniref:carbonic anhydrase n=1 Tax=Seminavis robusta TaxID=568900 RepID=A0A9N8H176_9STRA|nr:Carbonic anhydrase [Seminavis robusta]|eukprot:Sro34_g022110.1 Carbonic anhydrase (373) ;mRNA; f:142253-143472